jgi:hypothetical protein
LPPNLEPYRAALMRLSPAQRRQLRHTPELDPRLHAVQQALLEANGRRAERRNVAWKSEEHEQCKMAREVFRPPFVTSFAPFWRTSTVLALAGEIFKGRAFDRMPTLADALQIAGCKDTSVLVFRQVLMFG